MKNYRDLKEWISDGNENVFENHVAKRTELPTGENDCYIHFEDPNDCEGWMDFIYCNGVLTIQGDYGNCSICFYNKNNTIETLAGFAWNMGYFLSKLESAERAAIPQSYAKEFNQDTCIQQVQEHFKGYGADQEEFEDWKYHTTDYISWQQFCREEGEKFFKDQDAFEYMYNFGEINTLRSYLWCYGLIKAVEYLKEK